jgi:hypothetical protein
MYPALFRRFIAARASKLDYDLFCAPWQVKVTVGRFSYCLPIDHRRGLERRGQAQDKAVWGCCTTG